MRERPLPTDSAWESALNEGREYINQEPMLHNGLIRFARWTGDVDELDVGTGEYAAVIATREGASPAECELASLGSLLMLRDKQGKWVFARRHPSIQYGGVIGTSAAGQVDPGESWTEAAVREASEELGITVDDIDDLQALGTITHLYRGARGIDTIWVATIRDTTRLRLTDEVSEIIFGDIRDLEGEQLLPTLQAMLPLLQSL